MSTRTLARLALALVVLVAVAAACEPSFPDLPHTTTVDEAPPLTVYAYAYCDRMHGVEIEVVNDEPGNIPVTVQHDTTGDGTYEYTAELVYIAPNEHRSWSWPGSRPARLVVRLGGPTGLILVDRALTYPSSCL